MSEDPYADHGTEIPQTSENFNDEAVGYCRPPVHSRWKKGQSGNPRGRKKGSANLKTVLERQLSEKITVREGDGSRRITKLEAMVIAIINKAIKGDARAFERLTATKLRLDADPTSVESDAPSASDEAILAEYLARSQPKGGDA